MVPDSLEWRLTFDAPWVFLIVVPLLPALMHLRGSVRHRCQASRRGSDTVLPELPKGAREHARRVPLVLRLGSILLVVCAVAGPGCETSGPPVDDSSAGQAMLLVDVSFSMLALDVEPDRLGWAKALAERIVIANPRIAFGLMTFAADAVLECPVTNDHTSLLARLRSIEQRPSQEGTALGDAVLHALRRLPARDAVARRLVVISDGASNRGSVSAEAAAAAAAALGIVIDTISVGSSAPASIPTEAGPVQAFLPVDERGLRRLAVATHGAYSEASSVDPNRALGSPGRGSIPIDGPSLSYAASGGLSRILLLIAAGLIVVEQWLSAGWLKTLA